MSSKKIDHRFLLGKEVVIQTDGRLESEWEGKLQNLDELGAVVSYVHRGSQYTDFINRDKIVSISLKEAHVSSEAIQTD